MGTLRLVRFTTCFHGGSTGCEKVKSLIDLTHIHRVSKEYKVRLQPKVSVSRQTGEIFNTEQPSTAAGAGGLLLLN